ncbi:hypothetical protein T02_5136 [Trichinella nativa]|uniref:Uncharacterized protein n=1 Tax=Trichinella nativa TaxID=6335 RepID=A0A0V1KJZ8_9BILA|nr:hypothetical protein T02_1285 [Trichinella nativa]KRZ47604.1 hypothetical protein T02_213 [Trichinella nativa]KRZ47882.1 hypothetical protein T02_5136 [Trichinella nativa]
MRRNVKHIFFVEQHTFSSTFDIELPVDLGFGQTVSERQRCSDSVSQACQLPSSIEGIVFSADPGSMINYWNLSEEYWNVLPDTIVYDYQSKNREQLPQFVHYHSSRHFRYCHDL